MNNLFNLTLHLREIQLTKEQCQGIIVYVHHHAWVNSTHEDRYETQKLQIAKLQLLPFQNKGVERIRLGEAVISPCQIAI